ncbi:tripartite tricarboxylate transporter substrate binding protein [Micrococcoides hystricis]|uniref:Tripartite tricarboxylate transporter substrate binding protein n=1 Tax=Micrococcoides hystricis TaxID=1572761 RepID=A0ABV6PCG7_9MICC
MKKKALFAGIAVISSAALLTGCADTGGNTSGDGEYPEKDIRLIVPWQAGGSGDLSARTVAPLLEKELGVNVVVENMPGANGSIAYNWLTDQKPDGYNLSVLGMEVATLQYMDYDVDPANYTFLGELLEGPGAIAVKSDSPFESLQDLIDAAKEKPGSITYSSPGVGSVWDNPAQGFQDIAGIKLKNVPFDGSAPSIQAAAAGDVDFSIDAAGSQKANVDGGKMRYLAVLSEERLETLPDVPTMKELGVDLQNASFTGIMGPKDMDEAVVQKLSDAIDKAVQDPEYKDVIEGSNLVPVSRKSAEFTDFINEQAKVHGEWIDLAKKK